MRCCRVLLMLIALVLGVAGCSGESEKGINSPLGKAKEKPEKQEKGDPK